jgi:hypothetical protein
MSLKVAYFQPIVLAIDTVPPIEFSKIYSLVENLHSHPELNDSNNPFISIRGGQQIQVHPNNINVDVAWLTYWIEQISQGYIELIIQQSGTEELKHVKPVCNSIWTIKQSQDQYQEMHTHPGGHLSGVVYVESPMLAADSNPSDGQFQLRLPFTKDISKFIMNDSWKYSPTVGTVTLFPSHLAHSVYPWKGTGHRTVLAFDVILQPKDQ